MRLVDADALKYKNLAEVNGRLTYVLTAEEIDNAPTVENITVFLENADEETLEDIKKELQKVLDKLKERNDG